MKESQFGFEYSWADLQPIRALFVTVLVAQIIGAAAGLFLSDSESWFLRLWFGGAVATFPAFVLGLVVQTRARPGSISENRVIVRRLGLIALLLSIAAPLMAKLGFGA